MSTVPAEVLDIVRQLRDLTESGRLEWRESRPDRTRHAVAISLASGQWRLVWFPDRRVLSVSVWDGSGNSLFHFDVRKNDPSFSDTKAIFDAAVRHNRERITSTALNAMREELAAR